MSAPRGARPPGAGAQQEALEEPRRARGCLRARARRSYVILLLTGIIILIVYNALKVGNVNFSVANPTVAQYDAIFAVRPPARTR